MTAVAIVSQMGRRIIANTPRTSPGLCVHFDGFRRSLIPLRFAGEGWCRVRVSAPKTPVISIDIGGVPFLREG
jgi:hypothetical protein